MDTTPKIFFEGISYAWNVSSTGCWTAVEFWPQFCVYHPIVSTFFRECKEAINHETCREIKLFGVRKTKEKRLWLYSDFMASGGDFDPLTHINIILLQA